MGCYCGDRGFPIQSLCSICSALASAFGQESLDHILLHSFHNGGLCQNEAEELSKKSEESSAIYVMRDSNAVYSLRVPCTPLQTINLVPGTATRPSSIHWRGDHESNLTLMAEIMEVWQDYNSQLFSPKACPAGSEVHMLHFTGGVWVSEAAS